MKTGRRKHDKSRLIRNGLLLAIPVLLVLLYGRETADWIGKFNALRPVEREAIDETYVGETMHSVQTRLHDPQSKDWLTKSPVHGRPDVDPKFELWLYTTRVEKEKVDVIVEFEQGRVVTVYNEGFPWDRRFLKGMPEEGENDE